MASRVFLSSHLSNEEEPDADNITVLRSDRTVYNNCPLARKRQDHRSPASPWRSIEFECRFVVLAQVRVLILFPQKTVTYRQHLHFTTHETAEGILGGANEGLAADVEAGVYDNRAAGALVKPLQQSVIARVGFLVYSLNARGIIHMRHGWYFATRHIEPGDARELLLLRCDRLAPLLHNVSHQQHVRAVAIQLEPFGHVLPQHRRSEGTERLAKLHLQIEHRLHPGRPRVCQNGARPQRPRPELHASLKPAGGLLVHQRSHAGFDQLSFIHHLILRARGSQAPLDLALRKRGPQIGALHLVAAATHQPRLPLEQVIRSQRGAQRTAGITRRRLYPDALEAAVAKEFAVSHTIEH